MYSTQVTVYTGQTIYVTILPTDLDRNIDNDHDGYTNLAEVRIGTDPLNAYSVPIGESPYVICGNGITNIHKAGQENSSIQSQRHVK